MKTCYLYLLGALACECFGQSAPMAWRSGSVVCTKENPCAFSETQIKKDTIMQADILDGSNPDAENRPVRIMDGCEGAGRKGKMLGSFHFLDGGQWWTPVLWDGEEEPDFFKTICLEYAEITWKKMVMKP